MQFIQWSFLNISVPMIEVEEGKLHCTSQALCAALSILPSTLRSIHERYKHKLHPNCVSKCDAIGFMRTHREELGLKYVREDMLLWGESDMVRVAIFSQSERTDEFCDQLIELIKKGAAKNHVSREEYDALHTEHNDLLKQNIALRGQYEEVLLQCKINTNEVATLKEFLRQSLPGLNIAASAAGHALNAQKQTRALRELH